MKSEQKDSPGDFSYPVVHLTLQKITFPYKMGQEEEDDLNGLKKKMGKIYFSVAFK